MAVLPVYSKPAQIHEPDKVLPARGLLPAAQYRQGNILDITLYLTVLGFLQQLVGFLSVRAGFFPITAIKGLSLFCDMQPSFHTQSIRYFLHLLELILTLLQLVAVLIADTVHDEMCMNVLLIFVCGDQHFKSLPSRDAPGELTSKGVRLLRGDPLPRRKALDEMLICSPASLAP